MNECILLCKTGEILEYCILKVYCYVYVRVLSEVRFGMKEDPSDGNSGNEGYISVVIMKGISQMLLNPIHMPQYIFM